MSKQYQTPRKTSCEALKTILLLRKIITPSSLIERSRIVHFKELFTLDGKSSSFSEEDKGRRNTIANLLEEWDLVKIVEPEKTQDIVAPLAQIKILPYKEKVEWELVAKYNIGGKR